MRSTSGALRVALLFATTSLVATACLQPPRRTLPPFPGQRVKPERTANAEISLRLGAYEGASSLAVTGSAGGDLEFHREGSSIRCSNGALRREFALRPGSLPLTLDDCSYPGVLRIIVHPEGGLRAEVRLDFEEYVLGVVAGEIPLLRALPAELEAQAIAARSYALARWTERRRGGLAPFVWDDTRDQVYVPSGVARSPAERTARVRLEAAVSITHGQVLVRGGDLFDARYHAACGGSTSPLPSISGSTSVPCPGCLEGASGPTDWSFTAKPGELAQAAAALGIGDRLVTLEPTRTYEDGRWAEIRLVGDAGSTTTKLHIFRSLLGAARFASNHVLRTWPHPGQPITSGLRIEGRGRGHGVGMCQDGAHELARRGRKRAQILDHYYPGTSIQHWTAVPSP